MADGSEAQASAPVDGFKNRQARYRAKNRERRNAESAAWWAEHGAAYREANREKLKATAAAHRDRNRDKIRERIARFQSENPERCREHYRTYRQKNPDKRKESCAKWRAKPGALEQERAARKLWAAANKPALCAKASARRAAKMRATPPWANLARIEAIYAECARISRETGIVHHVDHIYPLKGKTMCGLHVENNLQILTGAENQSKGNRPPPDTGWA